MPSELDLLFGACHPLPAVPARLAASREQIVSKRSDNCAVPDYPEHALFWNT
jgi:hypothetical protein